MKQFRQQIQNHFDEKMIPTGKLFVANITGDQVWDLYLRAFPEEFDPVFRDPNSSTHNCNHCKNFIRRYGNIVAIDSEYRLITLFDIQPSKEYEVAARILSKAIRRAGVKSIFVETFDSLRSLPYEQCKKTQKVFKLGMMTNVKRYTKEEAELYGVVEPNEVVTFEHFGLQIPSTFVDLSGKSIESIRSAYDSSLAVFTRGLKEIPFDTLVLVRDLILQGSLLNGNSYLEKLEAFLEYKTRYTDTPDANKSNFLAVNAYNNPLAKFKNELIGVLCSELAEGKDLNSACLDWNKRADPANYMKATAPITKRQIEEAAKFVQENGYEESFSRRFATIDDINVSEIKHVSVGDGKVKEASIFDSIKPSSSTRHKRAEFDDVMEVSIEKFMTEILPGATSVELYLQGNHNNNVVSLTTANIVNSKPIFKWNNNFSWTYKGNLAGKSEIKDAVKRVGGKVDGSLRFSITWNEDGRSIVDYDAHCESPKGHIYYGQKQMGDGRLDVDMINPYTLGVENITWPTNILPPDGTYLFYIYNFNHRTNSGFKAEIEFDGQIYNYEGNTTTRTNIARITVKNGQFTIEHLLEPKGFTSKEVAGLDSEQFHKVNLVCLSPNYWGENNVGNKHYFFMLEKAKVDEPIRGFHNENLISDLLTHRKVMEVLGAQSMISPVDKQLTGLGFNATVRDEVILKVSGSHKRVIKVKF